MSKGSFTKLDPNVACGKSCHDGLVHRPVVLVQKVLCQPVIGETSLAFAINFLEAFSCVVHTSDVP